MSEKLRADVLLCRRNICDSRQKAQALIIAGLVYVDEVKINKASEMLDFNANLNVREKEHSYVSRGALKLEKALTVFGADIRDKVCLDIGAATGGFSDVLLQSGAGFVYAVDVGYGQFDWSLRNHPKIKLYERTNARYLDAGLFDRMPEVMVMDVSFISIQLILPRIIALLGEHARFYVLIKPQFEAGKGKVGKNGVVKDPQVHIEIIQGICDFLQKLNWCLHQLDYSPIKGPKGNIEYICEILHQDQKNNNIDEEAIRTVVERAHASLKTAQ